MKKLAMALLVAGVCAAPSLAQAEMTPYVRVAGGLGMANDSKEEYGGDLTGEAEFDSGLVLEGAFGVKIDMFRVEAAVGYQSNDVDKFKDADGTVQDMDDMDGYSETGSIKSYMINGYADFDMDGISPYVMAGMGIANVGGKVTYEDGDGDYFKATFGDQGVFAWQVGAGVGVKATDNITVDLGYRYFATSDITYERVDGKDLTFDCATSNIMLGMRYAF